MRTSAVIHFLSLALLAWPVRAQTSSGAPARPPGDIAPTPTNPLDTGSGTLSGAGSSAGVSPTAVPPPMPAPLPMTPPVPTPSVPTALSSPSLPRTTMSTTAVSLPPVLVPQPGGWTAERAAQRAVQTSAAVRAAQAGVEAARAQQAETGRAMIPMITLTGRYTRLSEFTPGSIPFFDTAACLMNIPECQTNPNAFVRNVVLQPPILNQYALRISVAVPLSDIPLRLLQLYNAAGLNTEARRIEVQVARAQAALQAREAFYEYCRSRAQLVAAEQALNTARRRRDDVARFVQSGTLAQVELLAADAAVADRERTVVLLQNGVSINEALLRQRLHLDPHEPIAIGEALDEPVNIPPNVMDLVQRAWAHRAELRSMDRQLRALDANIAAARASYFPSVSAAANFDYANPNPRIFPQTEQFRETWDATVALNWSPTQALTAEATVSRLQAQRAQFLAQLTQLREGIETEVRVQWNSARAALAQITAARAALASAQEHYRVRRERFLAGTATATDLAEAETQLLGAHIAVINAQVDVRLALARLRRAVGDE